MPAVELRGVGKVYTRLEEQATLLTSLLPFGREKKAEHWALRDVSFRVEPGETVGLLGRNGAGKTTMLRLLAGVSRPSEGTVAVRGRVAPLISVGVGFHQEMTGRENIFVNGMLLGLTKRQLQARFEEIVDFAEIPNFIDTPVKFYSSGMYMRLGFSVAAHVDPDVLLVDEVLAVGDISFQLKCIEKMKQLQRSGTTIILVSHSMHAIRLLCPRAILIRQGHLEVDGSAEEAIARHHQLMSQGEGGQEGQAGATFLERTLIGPDGPTHDAHPDDDLVFRLRVRFEREVDSPQAHFDMTSGDGTVVYGLTSVLGREGTCYAAGEEAVFEVPFTARMGAGTYRLRLTLFDRRGQDMLAYDPTGFMLYVPPQPGVGGVLDLKGAIRLDGTTISGYDGLTVGSAGNLPSEGPRPGGRA
jgi:ABC-2 type transport system ATP-binding protein